MDSLNVIVFRRQRALTEIAMLQAQVHRYETEEQMLPDDAGMTEPVPWQPGDRPPRPPIANGGPPELVHLATLKTHHFDIFNDANWYYKATRYHSAAASPMLVSASDQVVFWATTHMDKRTRGMTYPSDFDTLADIRIIVFSTRHGPGGLP